MRRLLIANRVEMPMACAVRAMRTAISPRLAISSRRITTTHPFLSAERSSSVPFP